MLQHKTAALQAALQDVQRTWLREQQLAGAWCYSFIDA